MSSSGRETKLGSRSWIKLTLFPVLYLSTQHALNARRNRVRCTEKPAGIEP